MKKITKCWLMLVAFLLLGVAKASAFTEIPIPSGQLTLKQEFYELHPATDGILTINFDRAIIDGAILGTSYNAGSGLIDGAVTPIEKGTTFKWEVVGGVTYYLEGTTITSASDPLIINSVEFESTGAAYPLQMFYKIQSANISWSTTGGSAFQSQGKGVYSQIFSVPANTYLRFYGDNTWYGPDSDVNITFTNNVYNGSIEANGKGFKFSEATAVAVDLDLSKGTVKMTKVDLPQVNFILPGAQDMEMVTGVQLMWGYYLTLSSCNPNNRISVKVPGYDTPFTYEWRISENVPGEELGGTGSGSPYPNGLNLQKFMYSQGGVQGTWQRKGDYEITVPANTVYITLDNGYKMPNPETTVIYHCAGTGGYFDDEYVAMLYPESNLVETINTVQVRFPTTLDSEGYSTQLKSATGTVPVQVSIDGGAPVTVQGTISTDRLAPNRVNIDMRQFENQPGVYTISFAEGVVFEDALPYMDPKKNRAVSFTLYVGVDDPQSVYFQFTGVKDSYKLVSFHDGTGFETFPDSNIYNYPINVEDDAYATIWVPWQYEIQVIAPEGLVDGTDYYVDYMQETNSSTDEDVNTAQITFLTEKVYGQTFKVQIGEEEEINISDVKPTINPEEGLIANDFPVYTVVSWNDLTVNLNSECTETVKVLVDGKEEPDQAGCWGAYPGVRNDEYETFEPVEEGQEGTVLLLCLFTPYLETGSKVITVEIPQGFVILGSDAYNAAAEFNYTVVAVAENITTNPRRGSQVFSLSTVDMTWAGFNLERNPDCTKAVVHGVSNDWGELEGAGTPVKEVKFNEDGSVTFDLGTTYETAGNVVIAIPEGYFLLSTEAGNVASPQPINLMYTVANYRTVPSNYESVIGSLSTFAVLGKESIAFTGDIANVEVSLWGEPVGATVTAANQTTIDGSPAIQFVLSEPLVEPEMYTITVPAGSLTIDGVAYNENIEWVVSVVEGAVADPEDGSLLMELSKVNVAWGSSALTIGNGEVTLAYGDQVDNVTECCSIEEYEVDLGFMTGTAYRLAINFNPAYGDGEYTLTIPAGFVYIDQYNMYNEEVVLHYTVNYEAGVDGIQAEENGEAVYYNLQGVRVKNPEKGQILIRVQNGKVTKMIK